MPILQQYFLSIEGNNSCLKKNGTITRLVRLKSRKMAFKTLSLSLGDNASYPSVTFHFFTKKKLRLNKDNSGI